MKPKKRRQYAKTPAAFPINITVKNGGNTFTYRLNQGDLVKCLFCGKDIPLEKKTVFRYRHKYDENTRVQCHECGYVADVVYYTSKKNRTSMSAWDSGLVKTTM